jgi:copper resistance protein B
MKKPFVPTHTAGLLAGLLALMPAAASSTAATPAAPLAHAGAHTMPQKPMPGHALSDMDDMEGMDGMEGTGRPAPAKTTTPRQQAGQRPKALPAVKAPTHAADMDNMMGMNMAMPTGAAHVSLPPLSPSARWPATPPPVPKLHYFHNMPPVMDHGTYVHILMEQLEGRYAADGSLFRYSGQAWFGTDHDKLWIKSEGTVDSHRTMSDGDHELLYDHAISTYFDLQAGTRLDLDSGPVRAWGAVGVQGLALYFFEVSATAYFNADGVAGKLEGSYDLLITNRLILQPQAELNFYSRTDPARGDSQGFSSIDAGLRLRYEFKRKLAPYIAVTYAGNYGAAARAPSTSRTTPANGPEDLRFTFGLRAWY